MQAQRYPSADAFLQAAEPFLLRAEAENNVILGLSAAMAAGGDAPADVYFATVRDETGLCLAGFSSLPWRLVVTRATTPDAVAPLVAQVAIERTTIREVLGPEPTVELFAVRLAEVGGFRAELRLRQGIYELRQVTAIDGGPPGHLRPATAADLPFVSAYVAGFQADIGEDGDAPAVAADRIAKQQVYLWDDEGVRAMAAWAGKTPNGIRVNLVYTPKTLRGRGYATAVVAALSRELLRRGNRYCFLYTDLGNATSNAIYQRIGYRQVSDAAVYALVAQP